MLLLQEPDVPPSQTRRGGCEGLGCGHGGQGTPGTVWDPIRGWTLKDGGKTGTQSTSPHTPCESRQEEETLRRPWGRGGGEAGRPEHRESPRAVQSPGSREGGAFKGGGLPDKIQKTQLNLNFKQ